MILRRLFLLLALVLVVSAQQEQSAIASSSNAPGDGDIAIMQKEIKWGMQEMQRYKMLRGEWPVRTTQQEQQEQEVIQELASRRDKPNKPKESTVRGAPRQDDATPHSTYWNLLVSVF
jgi:hypothetical protein